MTPDAPPPKPSDTLPADATAETSGDKIWRVAGLSSTAIEAARAAARQAGIPLAAWLAGLIQTVADRERAERVRPLHRPAGKTKRPAGKTK
jgi:hypothetical protein